MRGDDFESPVSPIVPSIPAPDPARTAGLDMVPAVPMEFGDPHEALYAATEDGMREFAGRLPVSEAERTPEGARDRFRRRTQAALERFQADIIAGQAQGLAGRSLLDSCEGAAEEYRRNIRTAAGTTPEALRHQTGC